MLFNTIKELRKYNPNFVSVTYGAGGGSTDKTIEWTRRMKEDYDYSVMMHLTCVGTGRDKIQSITDTLDKMGVDNILALRGDLPKDYNGEISKDFSYACDLVKHLRDKTGDKFSIGVAGYPEKHPECTSVKADIDYLKMKLDAGGDFVITQLFFDNDYFFDYLDKVRKAGIKAPVIAGIMPIINISQAVRFTEMCGASIPKPLLVKMQDKSAEDQYKIGIEYALQQSNDLWANGVEGLHFYTLNKYGAIKYIIDNIRH